MKKIAIIANGKLKKALKLKSELGKLLPENYTVIDKLTERQGHATELAFNAINEGADYIIAAGGDGTMNEVINGVMQSSDEQKQKITVGLFPLGGGNDFARTAQLPKSVKELARLILDEKHRKIDVGYVEYHNEDNEKVLRYFNNIAEIGVGAKTAEIVNNSKKKLGSTLTFFFAVLKAFIGYKHQNIRIKTDDFQWVGNILEVCVANGQYFGSGIGIAPGASLDDGELSLVVIGNMKVIHFLWYLPSLRKLKKVKHREVQYFKINECEVISQEKYPLEMDGENVGFTSFTAKVIPAAINFLRT